MSIAATFSRLVGAIHVEENKGMVRIDGLSTRFILKDLVRIFDTSKVAGFTFTTIGKSYVTFQSFFVPDVLFMLRKIRDTQDRRLHTNNRTINKIVTGLEENTWAKTFINPEVKPASILNFSHLSDLTITLLPHQMEFMKFYNETVPKYELTGSLLDAAPGSGKTITGLALARLLDADITIEVVPKRAVIDVWEKTITSLYKRPVTYWHSLSGDPIPEGCEHYIVHYEQLQVILDFVKKKTFKQPVIILDECHNFNEITSLRTELFVALCKALKCQHVLWMSGTPIKAIGAEAVPLMRTIDSRFNADVEERFKKIFGKSPSRAVEILKHRMGFVSYKIDKKTGVGNKIENYEIEVSLKNGKEFTLDHIRGLMRDFIEARMSYYETNMSKFVADFNEGIDYHRARLSGGEMKTFKVYMENVINIRKAYDPILMKNEVIFCNKYEQREIIPRLPPGMKERFKQAKSVYKYYHLKVQGEALGGILGKERTRCNVNIAQAYSDFKLKLPGGDMSEHPLPEIIDNSVNKTIIFTSFVEVVDVLVDALTKEGYKPLKVYGETNKDLPAIIKKFYEDEDANPLIATYQSLSTAVPIICADSVVLMNAPFRSFEEEQAIARADRLGQKEVVKVSRVYLNTGEEPNISTRSGDILKWSRDQVAAIMGVTVSDDIAALEGYYTDFNEMTDIGALEGFMHFVEGDDLLQSKSDGPGSFTDW